MAKSPETPDFESVPEKVPHKKSCSITEAFSRRCMERHQAKSQQESNFLSRLSEKLKAIFTAK